MPIIPLVQSKPIADAPAPVLNREKLPTVDNSAVTAGIGKLAAASQQPLVDGKALALPFAGLGAIGDAIAKTGSTMGALALKVQDARTDTQVANADSEMQMALAKHEAWRTETNADPATWGEDLQKRLEGVRQTYAENADLTPGARSQIDLRLTRFSGQAAASTMESAAKATFGQAKSSFLGTADAAIQSQDTGRFEDSVRVGLEKGYFFPHEAEALREQFTKEGERQKRQAEADAFDTAQNDVTSYTSKNGEADALKMLDGGAFGSFQPADAERLRSTIKQVSDSRSVETMNTLADGISKGDISSVARIDELLHDSPHVSPKVMDEAKRYLLTHDVLKDKLDREQIDPATGVKMAIRNAVEYRRKVLDYDPKKDPDRTQYFSLVADIGSKVEQSMAGELTGELYKKYGLNPPKAPVRPDVQQNVSRTLDNLFDPKAGAVPWKFEHEKVDAKGNPVIDKTTGRVEMVPYEDKAAHQRAIDAQSRIEMQMNDWFRDNPEKAQSLPEVKKKLNELLPEGTRMRALDSLQRLMPKQATLPGKDVGAGALFDVNGSLTLPTK